MRFLFVAALYASTSLAADAPPVTTSPTTSDTAPAVMLVETPLTLSVAVLDLKGGGDVKGIAKALTTLVTSEVGAHAGYRAISKNELKAVLAHQADQRLLGCDEPQCLADIGKLAQAQRVIAGSVEQSKADVDGGAVVFSLTLIDPEGPVVLERVAFTWRSAVDDMVDLARPAVDRLLLGKKADALTGGLDILAPDGATIVVDNQELGAAPLKPIQGLSIGVHHIKARKAGFLPWDLDVAVSQGDSQVVQVDLLDETSVQPVWARWYVWGSALAGVVVIGGTVATIGTYQYLTAPAKLVVGGAAK